MNLENKKQYVVAVVGATGARVNDCMCSEQVMGI